MFWMSSSCLHDETTNKISLRLQAESVKDAAITHHLRHETALLWFYFIDVEHKHEKGEKTIALDAGLHKK